jgi:hypothetical protein
MPKKKRSSVSSAARLAKRVAAAYKSSLGGGNYGAAIAKKAAEDARKAVAAAYKSSVGHGSYGSAIRRSKKKKRRSKKKASPAQLRARKAFAERMRAGSKYNPRKASKKERKLYSRALRDARRVGVSPARRKKTGKKRRSSKKGQTVTAAQVIAMAKKGALQKWLCQGRKRTGCGSTGRVVSGRGAFRRIR